MSMEFTNPFKNDGIQGDNTISNVFGEDGKVQPWAFQAFKAFLSTFSKSSQECDGGNVTRTKGEAPSNSEIGIEMVHKASSPSFPKKQKGSTQQESIAKEFPADDEVRKEMLLQLIQLAANKGGHLLKDASFLEFCTKMMMLNREFMDNNESRMEKAKAKGKQTFCTEAEMIQSYVANEEAFQGEERPNEGDTVHGPSVKVPENISFLLKSKGETANHGPVGKDHCAMARQEDFARRNKQQSNVSSEDGHHVPQNVEKVLQLFQKFLEQAKPIPHVSQVKHNGGKSSLSCNQGQTDLVDNARVSCHVNWEENSKIAQESTREQESGRNEYAAIDEKNSNEACTLHKGQSTPSFVDILKYGKINTSLPLSSQLTVETEKPSAFSKAFFNAQVSSLDEEGGSLVKVPSETIQKRLEFCKLSVIGRVILVKGEAVWSSMKLRAKLNEVWGFSSSWRLICLGKGYFHFLFSSQEEFDKCWERGVIQLNPGILRIQKFHFGVDHTKEKSTSAQVWFRFFNLPWCLWDSSILAALSWKIGTPLRFDNNTINGDFGFYARVLIEVDLSKSIKSVLHLDCGNNIFDIKVFPENIPKFCKACSNIGHSYSECRILKKKGENGQFRNNNSSNKVEHPGKENVMGKNRNFKETCGKHLERMDLRQTDLEIEERVENHRNHRNGSKSSAFQRKDNNHCYEGGHDNRTKESKPMEMITDFGAQLVNNDPKDAIPNGMFSQNKFSILYDLDGAENGYIGDESHPIEEGPTSPQRVDDSVKEQLLVDDLIITKDIGKQPPSVSLLQGAKDVQTSNKFAALEQHEDREAEKEDNGIQNSDIEEAKGDDQVQNVPLSKGDVQHTLKGIRMWAEKEKRNITQLIEKSGKVGEKEVRESHTPKTPKRWSDIQDEEDEKEDEQANSNFYVPQPDDVLSFERNGELTEIFMRNGEVRFTPISDKNKN